MSNPHITLHRRHRYPSFSARETGHQRGYITYSSHTVSKSWSRDLDTHLGQQIRVPLLCCMLAIGRWFRKDIQVL